MISKLHKGRNIMRKLSLLSGLLLSTGLAAPALADGHLQIVDEPLTLTIPIEPARPKHTNTSPSVANALRLE